MKLEANGNFLTEAANEFHKGLCLIRESPFDLKANCLTKKETSSLNMFFIERFKFYTASVLI